MAIDVVWLKRDLRTRDHWPLVRACRSGPVAVVYVHEPERIHAPTHDACHLEFIEQSLDDVDRTLRQRGARLLRRVGDLPHAFDALHRELSPVGGIGHIWSHQESGDLQSFARDERIRAWCRAHDIPLTEVPQHGVVRPLKTRDGWSALWADRMTLPVAPDVDDIPCVTRTLPDLDVGERQTAETLGIAPNEKIDAQPGGESEAWERLGSFLDHRGVNYRADMSTPVAGWDGCSRLSPHLAYGTLSVREAYLQTRERVDELRAMSKEERDGRWLPSLRSFEGRLRWHCHFMQKLEDEPDLELRAMNRALDDLRAGALDSERFDAWCHGQTGYPMVDAVMRCLARTGWINFRMRAMVVSFASYHLWLDWRPTSTFLARQFVDYEPGIHFSQFQMQSGVTGINAVRVYSPAKQVKDQDPRGVFIRRWVPELENVLDEHLPEPHLMNPLEQSLAGCVIGEDYPAPVVCPKASVSEAKSIVFAARKTDFARSEAARVYEKHGSRKRPRNR